MHFIKNLIKLLLINIFIFSLLAVIADYSIYLKFRNNYYNNSKFHFPTYLDNYKENFSLQSVQAFKILSGDEFRLPVWNDNYKKAPILIFGCSYAHGFLLDDNQTINFKLSNLTERNVFNFALCACGIQHMLYIINQNFFNILNKFNTTSLPPEYAIFVYIPNHLKRLQSDIFPGIECSNGINLKYHIHNNELILEDYPSNFLYKTFLIKFLHFMLDRKKESNKIKYKYDSFMLANEIFLECKRVLKSKFPNIKFVILNYQTEEDNSNLELDFMFDVYQKEGFIVINSSDLIKRKFRFNSSDTAEDGYHPSELAWDILLPALSKELNL